MKVLLDSCVWAGAKEILEEAGHETVWIGDFLLDPGDEAIIDLAYREERVLVTIDKDFGELAVVKEAPHRGIVRIVNYRAVELGPICVQVLQKYAEELQASALITVDKSKIRVRRKND